MSPLGVGAGAAAVRRHPARYLAFVLRSGAPDEVRLLDMGDADAIDRAVAAVRAAITGDDEMTGAPLASEGERSDAADDDVVALRAALGNATRHLELSTGKRPAGEADSVASKLRTKIWDPLMPAVHQSTRLFLAPDGDLVRIPFEMLPLPDGRRLLEAYELSYLSVGRDLVSSSSGDSQKGTEPIVVANPDFDAGQTGSRVGWPFRHLQNTKLEAELVGRHLGVEPLTGAAASKTAATTVVSPRVLHLATHGVFLPDSLDGAVVPGNQQDARHSLGRLKTRWVANPLLRSFLALAGANTWLAGGTPPEEAGDGLLTAEEVAVLDLRATELVVLSACETGLGAVRVGEGVFGLRRAFVLAGAKTLVMSLWKVPDAQTRELMDELYTRLLAGHRRADALRGAQLALKDRYADPFYWAAFICQGEAGPIELR